MMGAWGVPGRGAGLGGCVCVRQHQGMCCNPKIGTGEEESHERVRAGTGRVRARTSTPRLGWGECERVG
jgi:hypothetical protein